MLSGGRSGRVHYENMQSRLVKILEIHSSVQSFRAPCHREKGSLFIAYVQVQGMATSTIEVY